MVTITIDKIKEIEFYEFLKNNYWIQKTSESIYALESNKIIYIKGNIKIIIWDKYTVDYLQVEGDGIELNRFDQLFNFPKKM